MCEHVCSYVCAYVACMHACVDGWMDDVISHMHFYLPDFQGYGYVAVALPKRITGYLPDKDLCQYADMYACCMHACLNVRMSCNVLCMYVRIYTLNPKPRTLSPIPSTLNPKPEIICSPGAKEPRGWP